MNFIFSNFFTIFFAIAVIFLVYSQFKKRKDATTKAALHKQSVDEAQARNMKVTTHADGLLTSGGEITGDTI